MKKSLFILFLSLIFIGCSKDDDTEYKVVKISIKDASFLYSVDKNQKGGQAFSINKSGETAPLSFITDKGDVADLEDMYIFKILDVNEKYFLLQGKFCLEKKKNIENVYSNLLLVDKISGAIHAISLPSSYGIAKSIYFYSFTDKLGNIYLQSHYGDGAGFRKIFRINTDSMSAEEYISSTNSFNKYMVNPNGIVYCSSSRYTSGGGVFYNSKREIYSIEQLIEKTEEKEPYINGVFLGFNGMFYVHRLDKENKTMYIYKIDEDEKTGELSAELVTTFEINKDSFFSTEFQNFFIPNHKKQSHILSSTKSVLEFNEKENNLQAHDVALGQIERLDLNSYYTTSDALYINNAIDISVAKYFTKMNLSTNEVSKLDFASKGYVMTFVASSPQSDVLTFGASNSSKTKYCIGQIDEDGTISVFENVHPESEVTSLIRLN